MTDQLSYNSPSAQGIKLPKAQSLLRSMDSYKVLMVVMIIIASAYWLWIGIDSRSIDKDDGISILAAQGILEHGYPVLPSGSIYTRSFLPSYVLAGSIGLWGLNDFAIVLPGLLAAIGSFVLVYLLASHVLRRPMVGVVAAPLLLLSHTYAFYATGPRMYMPLQFFTLLAVYAGWRGFVQEQRWYKWITIGTLVGAIATHEQGALLPVAIITAIIATRYLRGGLAFTLRRVSGAEAVLAALVLVGLFSVYLRPTGGLELIAVHGGISPDRTGFTVDLQNWKRQLLQLEKIFPLTLPLLFTVAWPLLQAINQKTREKYLGFLFLSVVLAVAVLAMVSYLQEAEARYWFFVIPIYLALLIGSCTCLVGAAKSSNKVPLITGGIVWSIGAIILLLNYSPSAYADWGREGYKIPCCLASVESEYREIKPVIGSDERVISDTPWVTNYYLGRVDGFIRQVRTETGFDEFESSTDEYFGAPLIDTPDELMALAEGDTRTWIILGDMRGEDPWDHKYIGSTLLNFVSQGFEEYARSDSLVIYVTSP